MTHLVIFFIDKRAIILSEDSTFLTKELLFVQKYQHCKNLSLFFLILEQISSQAAVKINFSEKG